MRIVAGAMVLTGVILGRFVHPAFLLISAFVGAGLIFAGITDWCGMGLLLAKMPWNQRSPSLGGPPKSGACCAAAPTGACAAKPPSSDVESKS